MSFHLVRPEKNVFLSPKGGRGCVFDVFLCPLPEMGILDYTTHGSIIQKDLRPPFKTGELPGCISNRLEFLS